jgi:hypothetical protein
MSTINDGGPTWLDQKREMWALRDWFATHATEEDIWAIQNPPSRASIDYREITRYEARYLHADAMLAARGVKP